MSVELLFVASTELGALLLVELGRACARRGTSWACFFTGDGVKLLARPDVRVQVSAATRAVACEHSWDRRMGSAPCPVELGSQTDHSALVANAAKVLTV